MKGHAKEYRQLWAKIVAKALKTPFFMHRSRLTIGWKRAGKVSRDNIKSRESTLEEYLAKNVRRSLNNFSVGTVKPKLLSTHAVKLQEEKNWNSGKGLVSVLIMRLISQDISL